MVEGHHPPQVSAQQPERRQFRELVASVYQEEEFKSRKYSAYGGPYPHKNGVQLVERFNRRNTTLINFLKGRPIDV